MTTPTRRFTGIAAAGVLATAGLAVGANVASTATAAGPAPDRTNAMRCSHAHSDQSPGVNAVAPYSINIRSGPHAGANECPIVGTANRGDVIGAHCWTINEAGVRWVYVRDKTRSPDVLGWVRGDLLRDEWDGTVYNC